MNILVSIAAGGAAGALSRHFMMILSGHWFGLAFPYGTLLVNIAGSLLLGALMEGSALFWTLSQELRAFLVVGFLGSFTTFSTFSLDVVLLMERGQWGSAFLFVAASLFLSIGGFFFGMWALRTFWA